MPSPYAQLDSLPVALRRCVRHIDAQIDLPLLLGNPRARNTLRKLCITSHAPVHLAVVRHVLVIADFCNPLAASDTVDKLILNGLL